MSNRTKWIFALVCLAALLSAIYLLLEWEEKTIDLGPTQEALQQPFLALEHYLSLDEIEVELEGRYSWLDDQTLRFASNDVVLLVDSYGTLSPERASRLLDWVAKGGHLIMTASNPRLGSRQAKDPIFDKFGVERLSLKSQGLDYDKIEALEPVQRYVFNDLSSCKLIEPQLSISFKGEEYSVKASFPQGHFMNLTNEQAKFSAGTDEGNLLIQYDHQEGLITLASNLDLWKNQLIGCHDHAYFLTRLLGSQAKVWLLFNRESQGPIRLMIRFIPITSITLLLLLGLWVVSISGRFGPRRLAPIEMGRNWTEHLLATGQFYLHHNQQQYMVDTMRQRIWQQWKKACPHQPQEGDNALKAMAQHLDLPYGQLKQIMTTSAPDNAAAFVRLTQHLQTIRKQL